MHDPRTQPISACPVWCATQHDHADEEWDGHHTSAPVVVPAVAARISQVTGGTIERHAEVAEFTVLAQRRADEPADTWIIIEGERQWMEITLESARRIYLELGRLLARVD
tara:strand:+ start:6330 stop:6659 length:330 start_codon:yes stop_codon:yes gene_type:complete